jgi:hypothetical protein
MNSEERDSSEEFTLVLQGEAACVMPQPKILQLEALAAKRGVEPGKLINRALKRPAKDRAFADRAFSRALEIFTVRYLEHQNDWPFGQRASLL